MVAGTLRRTCLIGAIALSALGSAHAQSPPRLIMARGELLAESRRLVREGNIRIRPAYLALIHAADSALLAPPISVMQKSMIPPSGNKHDYMSYAPYYWPDSTKPGGVPYINRDGLMNPQSRIDHDGLRLQRTIDAVQILALAHYFTGDRKYADGAVKRLRVFFIDTATRMNPNLQFAQAIPGVTQGRGIGIIDTRHMPQLVDAIRLLENYAGWTNRDASAFRSWCRQYLDWLETSKNGRDERSQKNNHGTWYDMQVSALALFMGDTALARSVIGVSAKQRVDSQFAADGSQPLELARTRPLHYSLFNLDAFTQLAEMGRNVGVDLWNYTSPRGGSLRKALQFLSPYAYTSLKFPKPDVTPVTADVVVVPFRRASAIFSDTAFEHAAERADRPPEAPRWWGLFYPGVPAAAVGNRKELFDRALSVARSKLRSSAMQLDPGNGFPRASKGGGSWQLLPANQWTSGFFAGSLWYMYELNQDKEWRTLAERWTVGLEPMKSLRTTHDLGFMIFDSFGRGFLATGNKHYRDVVMDASRSLVTRYNPRVGAIKSWDIDTLTDSARKDWRYTVIIDNLMNLEMLFWASRNGGESSWRSIAERHALTSARVHLRADGSTAHVALFDPVSGALQRTTTWQGYSDSSVWARGQAWAIYGFTTAYRYTRNPELLRASELAADWFVKNLPPDGVPWWDMRHPDIPNVERDASAAAIAASGLLELSSLTSGERASRYHETAERILATLSARYIDAGGSGAILQHAVGSRPHNSEVDVGLVYADYYFIEALIKESDRTKP